MKKLLACGLILTMLTSTGAMCFATEEVEIVDTIPVVSTEVEKETQDEKTAEKEELLNGLEEIKEDSALTWKEKVSRAGEYVKEFVKKHYVAIGAVTVSVALFVLAGIFGPKLVESIVALFKSNKEEESKEVVIHTEEKFKLTEKDSAYMVFYLLWSISHNLRQCKSVVERENKINRVSDYLFRQVSLIGDDAKAKMDELDKQLKTLEKSPETKQDVMSSIDDFIQWLNEKRPGKQEIQAIARRIIEEECIVTYQTARDRVSNGDYEDGIFMNYCTFYLPENNGFRKYLEKGLVEYIRNGTYQSKRSECITLIDQYIEIFNSFIEQLGE